MKNIDAREKEFAKKCALTSFFLRVSLATVFLYAAVSSILDPVAWQGFLPEWMRALIPPGILLLLFSVYEIFLVGWLLSSKKIVYAASLSGLTLLAIIVSNIRFLDIVFRDAAIFFSALALIALHRDEAKIEKKVKKNRK